MLPMTSLQEKVLSLLFFTEIAKREIDIISTLDKEQIVVSIRFVIYLWYLLENTLSNIEARQKILWGKIILVHPNKWIPQWIPFRTKRCEEHFSTGTSFAQCVEYVTGSNPNCSRFTNVNWRWISRNIWKIKSSGEDLRYLA